MQIVHLARGDQRLVERAHLSNVSRQLRQRRHARPRRVHPVQKPTHQLKKILYIAQEEIVLAAEVRVERRPAHARAIQHLLHRDLLKWLFVDERHQGIAQRIPRPLSARVPLRFAGPRFCRARLSGTCFRAHARFPLPYPNKTRPSVPIAPLTP